MDFRIINNKHGAVNSYRFIAMYIIIGMLMGMITMMGQDTTDVNKGYDLKTESRIIEGVNDTQNVYEESQSLVQANQYSLGQQFGDEKGLGRNWWNILSKAVIPSGFISESQIDKTTDLERGLNQFLIWFRIIITFFAGYEAFQIIFRKVT